ncbi:MAG: 50S ribosomal protein L5 [Candidatus Pacebacteria bacterium]|nr:50S ribosomal protein L5 [Candidatus Paceibacterota bacterium]
MQMFKEKTEHTFEALKERFSYRNKMQSPRLLKVVINVGIGSIKDPKKKEVIQNRLIRITGQKPLERGAKKSIASFKTRQGDKVAYQVTLRGKRMHDFLDRLVHIAFPRTKDFRGIATSGIDEMGNYTLGIREHIIFPEASDEEIKDVFGLAVTIVTTAKTREEARAFFEYLGFPFRKEDKK